MLGAEYQTRRSLGKQSTPRVLLGNWADVEPQGYRATTDSCNLKRRLWVVYRHAGSCWDKSSAASASLRSQMVDDVACGGRRAALFPWWSDDLHLRSGRGGVAGQ